MQVLRIINGELRGRCALAAIQEASLSRKPLLKEARRSIQLLDGEQRPCADALARLLRAGLAFVEGHQAAAHGELQRVAEDFERADMKLHAAVARWRHGQFVGGVAGHAEVSAAEKLMSDEGIVNPQRWVRMLTPYFPDA